MWCLLVDNGEVYWHKTLWLTSESLCRFAGLAVEQCESLRHGDKHIMEIDGQERCQEPFFFPSSSLGLTDKMLGCVHLRICLMWGKKLIKRRRSKNDSNGKAAV